MASNYGGSLAQSTGPLDWDLTAPIPSELDELREAPANVLRPHGRGAAFHVALQFGERDAGREWLADISRELTNAYDELQLVAESCEGSKPVLRTLALTRSGYDRLGIDAGQRPRCPLWNAGMSSRQRVLSDPPQGEWDDTYAAGMDALLIIAHDDPAVVLADFRRLFARRPTGASVIGLERGQRILDQYGSSIEHFGYADGISQPRFFSGDVAREKERNRFTGWDPSTAPSSALVPCPSGRGYGSYLVYRKLEQNVRAFQLATRALGKELGLEETEWEKAGSLLVGRSLDGRPTHLLGELDSPLPVENGFTYPRQRPTCPASSHIRKMNPRNGTAPPLMARRGMPYGDRPRHPHAQGPVESYPDSGVGLLFLAYVADLAGQFESIQQAANSSDGYSAGTDPIIGQGTPTKQQWETPLGRQCTADVGGFVTLKGGEYLYAPSPCFFEQFVGPTKKSVYR